LRFGERGIELARFKQNQRLAGLDCLAFFDDDFKDPAADLGADVNIVRLDNSGDDEFIAMAEDIA
jgi:hypothetical protein